jgi:hypothetical protein
MFYGVNYSGTSFVWSADVLSSALFSCNFNPCFRPSELQNGLKKMNLMAVTFVGVYQLIVSCVWNDNKAPVGNQTSLELKL